MATVVTVLRSGGEFNASHVRAMQRQVERWAPPGTRFVCISDVPIGGVCCLSMANDWPGWWAKMELFRPDLPIGDFLYTDLDNVILGPIGDFFDLGAGPVMQSGGWTALMWLPDGVRWAVWDWFLEQPTDWMRIYAKKNRPVIDGVGNYGDAGFISNALAYNTWEDVLPGQTMNIARMIVSTPLGPRWASKWPQDTRVMLCGQPHRPWRMPMFQKLDLYGENL